MFVAGVDGCRAGRIAPKIKRRDANGNSLCVTDGLRPRPSGHSYGTGLHRKLVVSSFRGRDCLPEEGGLPVSRPKHTLW
jgi:hypothetical protein